jgi:hypothetical protein
VERRRGDSARHFDDDADAVGRGGTLRTGRHGTERETGLRAGLGVDRDPRGEILGDDLRDEATCFDVDAMRAGDRGADVDEGDGGDTRDDGTGRETEDDAPPRFVDRRQLHRGTGQYSTSGATDSSGVVAQSCSELVST